MENVVIPNKYMNKEYKQKYPEWTRDEKKYYMCLSDDLDSFFSCLLLKKTLGYEITHYYDFDELYQSDNYQNDGTILVGIDMDIVKSGYRVWGNHCTCSKSNSNAANINNIERINLNNYTAKYAGSTLLQIISYYNLNISMLSEEAMMILLAVDTTFKMYGFNKENCKYYLVDVLELPELYELCEKHTQKEFYDLIEKYNLHEKIYIENGMLETSIDLKSLEEIFNMPFVLPKIKLHKIHTYENIGLHYDGYKRIKKQLESEGKQIFTKAWTQRTYVKISY